MAAPTHAYRYLHPSGADPAAGRLGLATSGGTTAAGPAANPRFYTGFLGRAEQAAAVEALQRHRDLQRDDREQAGAAWRDSGLVLTTSRGTALDAANVRRGFRQIVKRAGLARHDWTPRELRHSFVSLLSDDGVSLEDIADLCGHAGTHVTEVVYRHQLRPVLLGGAVAMDRIFPAVAPDRKDSYSVSYPETKKDHDLR